MSFLEIVIAVLVIIWFTREFLCEQRANSRISRNRGGDRNTTNNSRTTEDKD